MISFFRNSRLIFLLSCFLLFSLDSFCSDPQPTLRFIENKDQWPKDIRFMSDVSSGKAVFMNDRFRFYFYGYDSVSYGKSTHKETPPKHAYNDDGSHVHSRYTSLHIYDVQFVNANSSMEVHGKGQLITRYNYFVGSDRRHWASNVRSFSGVRYEDVYCGIDLDVYSANERIKYEWIVSPEENPYQIKLKYTGAENIWIENGDIHIKTSVSEITELKPFAYQVISGDRVPVACEFHLDRNVVSYSFPEGYDHCEKLIIDPILIFSAYSGSTSDNWGNTAAYDARGNVYSGGIVSTQGIADGFPTTPGAYQIASAGDLWDIGILKFDSSGSQLLYATYLGGNSTEVPQSLVVNSRNELLILGVTGSTNFPVTNSSVFKRGESIDPLSGIPFPEGTDIFVAKFSENGDDLLGGTYLGGTQNDGVNFVSGDMGTNAKVESALARNYGDQLRGDIITGENDTIYIASNTLSSDFEGMQNTFGGGISKHDAVVVKLAPDLSAIKNARYIGGTGADAAYSIKLRDGKVYIGGGTDSRLFPGINGLKKAYQGGVVDGWVAELSDVTLAITNATYLGTSRYDQVYFIDLNEAGDVFAFGQTNGLYEVVGRVYTNFRAGQFIHKLSSDLTTTHFSTVIGSVGGTNIQPNISPTAFLVSDCDVIYLSGWGGSINASVQQLNSGAQIFRNYVGGSTSNMPVSPDAYQNTTSGNDFYFMVLSGDGSEFLYGTYLGGAVSQTHVDGGTSRFDKRGIVYHAVCAGCRGNSDFPAVNVPAAHARNRSSNCNNAVFKFDLTLLKAQLQTNTVQLNMPGIQAVCMPDPIVFQNLSFGGKIYEWDFGDGTRITKSDTSLILHEYKNTGQYKVKLKCINQGTCKGVDSTQILITVYNAQSEVQEDDALCKGDSYTLKASGGAAYAWRSGDDFTSTQAQPQVSPPDTTIYYVRIMESNGCVLYDTVQLNVIPLIKPDFKFSRVSECSDRASLRVINLTDSVRAGDYMFFDWGDGNTSDQPDDIHPYEKDGIYHLRLVTTRDFCVTEKTADIPIFTITLPNIITPGIPEGKNDKFTIRFGNAMDESILTPGDYGFKVDLTVYNRWGNILFQKNDYQYDWAGEGLTSGIYYYEVSIQDHATCKSWIQLVR